MARNQKKKKIDTTPKLVGVFKFSTRNKSDAAYRDRLRVLKNKYGATGIRANAALTPQRKSAITRATRKLVEFLNPANGFQFVPTPEKTKRAAIAKGGISRKQATAKGIFVPIPKTLGERANSKRQKTKVEISKRGKVRTKTGEYISTFETFRREDVAKNPELIARAMKKAGAERAFISIRGHRGKSEKFGYSLKMFMQYLKNEILPDLNEIEEEETGEESEFQRFMGKKKKKSSFRESVSVEFVTYNWKR